MKALVLDGAPEGDALTAAAVETTRGELERRGLEVRVVRVRDLEVAPCTGCFGCWVRRPGECVIDDDARAIAQAIVASDVYAVVSPVRFGTWGSLAKGVMDRSICLVLPFFTTIDGEIHHVPRYSRYPAFVGIGTQAEADPASADAFARLVGRNAINMHNGSHASAVVGPGDDVGAAVSSALDAARVGERVTA